MKHLLTAILTTVAIVSIMVSGACSQPKSPTPARFELGNRNVSVFTTANGTEHRLSKTGTLRFEDAPQPLETEVCVFVDPSKTFQTMEGIGGAITDASAETWAKLPPDKQKEIIQAYYDPQKGIGYTLARTSIHSCDFSSSSYTYVADDDEDLHTFSIDHDQRFRIPMIKEAIASAAGSLKVYASPWSPPAWMKDTKDMVQGGKLLPAFRQAWANYFVRFIAAYEKAGVPIWAVTVQNEPLAKQTWESCIFTAEEERDFVKAFLGPTLHAAGMADKKLIVWDHNRDLIYQRASTILEDPEAARYVWGIGYHWYETWTGSDMQFSNLHRVAEAFPDKKLIFTEGTVEKFDYAKMGDWSLGEKYGRAMIHDFNSGAVGWTDWNILLDETGGPNHVGNFCYAPLIGDTRDGSVHYVNSYYYIGHFSKFIRPGARRVVSSANRDALQTTAFMNPDGTIAVVVLNATDKELPYRLWISGRAAKTTSLPHSIATLVL